MLAHNAFREAVVAAEAIAGKASEEDWRAIPAAIFSVLRSPTLGTQEEATARGRPTKTGRMPFAANGAGGRMAMRETRVS